MQTLFQTVIYLSFGSLLFLTTKSNWSKSWSIWISGTFTKISSSFIDDLEFDSSFLTWGRSLLIKTDDFIEFSTVDFVWSDSSMNKVMKAVGATNNTIQVVMINIANATWMIRVEHEVGFLCPGCRSKSLAE